MTTTRFQPFTDLELEVLWREIVFDDGVLYRPTPDSLEFKLLAEIEREYHGRGKPMAVSLTGPEHADG